MKETTASTFVEITCECPYCEAYLDIFDNDHVKDSLDGLRSEKCDLEITCNECSETFIVTDICY